jgi:hypothetical protein
MVSVSPYSNNLNGVCMHHHTESSVSDNCLDCVHHGVVGVFAAAPLHHHHHPLCIGERVVLQKYVYVYTIIWVGFSLPHLPYVCAVFVKKCNMRRAVNANNIADEERPIINVDDLTDCKAHYLLYTILSLFVGPAHH